MRCPSCEPDYCACADFYGGRLLWGQGKLPAVDDRPLETKPVDDHETPNLSGKGPLA